VGILEMRRDILQNTLFLKVASALLKIEKFKELEPKKQGEIIRLVAEKFARIEEIRTEIGGLSDTEFLARNNFELQHEANYLRKIMLQEKLLFPAERIKLEGEIQKLLNDTLVSAKFSKLDETYRQQDQAAPAT